MAMPLPMPREEPMTTATLPEWFGSGICDPFSFEETEEKVECDNNVDLRTVSEVIILPLRLSRARAVDEVRTDSDEALDGS